MNEHRAKFAVCVDSDPVAVSFYIGAVLCQPNMVGDLRLCLRNAERALADDDDCMRAVFARARAAISYHYPQDASREVRAVIVAQADESRVVGDFHTSPAVWSGVVLMALFDARFGARRGMLCGVETLRGELSMIADEVCRALDYPSLINLGKAHVVETPDTREYYRQMNPDRWRRSRASQETNYRVFYRGKPKPNNRSKPNGGVK